MSLLPEGSSEAAKLRKLLREANSNLGRLADAGGTLLVIVAAGVILKLFDFTSAKETEFNDKAHAFAASAIASENQFAEAANQQKVAAQTLERTMLYGGDVTKALADYNSSFSSYQLKSYNIIRLSDNGDIRHFLSGNKGTGDPFPGFGYIVRFLPGKHANAAPESTELTELQTAATRALEPEERHHACLAELAGEYPNSPAAWEAEFHNQNSVAKLKTVVCQVPKGTRLYELDDELTRLDSCQTELERQIYNLADGLISKGWGTAGMDLKQSTQPQVTRYREDLPNVCLNEALRGTPVNEAATIDRVKSAAAAQTTPSVAPPITGAAGPVGSAPGPSPTEP